MAVTAASSSYVSGASSNKGFSGLASGVDTESMVEQLLSGTQSKIDKQEGLKQQLQWKQEIYRDIISQINSFQTKFFSFSSSSNLMSDAFFNAIKDEKMSHFTFLDYASHAITDGSDSQGVAYILLQDQRTGKQYWGVGLSHNINLAPLRAILAAINRAKKA